MKALLSKPAILLAIGAVLLAGAAVSCTKDAMSGTIGSTVGVSVNVRGESTKTAAEPERLARVIPMAGGSVEEYVSDYPFTESPATKGATLTTSGINTVNTQFNMEGWLGTDILTASEASDADKSNRHFLSDVATKGSDGWSLQDGEQWRNGINTTFWSYFVPSDGPSPDFSMPGSTPTDAQLQSISFTYDLPTPGTSNNDAAGLKDLLVAYNYKTGATAGGNVDVQFNHPLAAIKFAVNNTGISGGTNTTDNDYVNITKVEILGASTSGSFTATGSGTNAVTFSCTASTDTTTYTQAATRAQIADGFFTADNSEYVFFMIPQDLTDVKVRLTMQRHKRTLYYGTDGMLDHDSWSTDYYTFTRTVSLGTGSWESGKYYTYRINSTVYFGGETLTLDPDNLETSGGVSTEGGRLEFNVDGTSVLNVWIAPLNVTEIMVVRVNFIHNYNNNSGKSNRVVWLEDGESSLTTKDASLVAEARTIANASEYCRVPKSVPGMTTSGLHRAMTVSTDWTAREVSQTRKTRCSSILAAVSPP